MTQRLKALIQKNQEDENYDFDDAVSKLAQSMGWNNLLKDVYEILSSTELKTLWYDATCCLYFAVLDNIDLPISTNECIARLYWCLKKYPELGSSECGFNLVWSITSSIKCISYNSSWQPLTDKEIQSLIESF